MLLRLALLLEVRQPGGVGLQHGLPLRAPLAPMDQPKLVGQLVDPAADLLARVVGDRGEDVPADLLVAEPLVAPLEGAERSEPCAGVDVLDLVVVERTLERAADHRARRAPQLLVEAPRSIAPRRCGLGGLARAAGGSCRRHTRLSTVPKPADPIRARSHRRPLPCAWTVSALL